MQYEIAYIASSTMSHFRFLEHQNLRNDLQNAFSSGGVPEAETPYRSFAPT